MHFGDPRQSSPAFIHRENFGWADSWWSVRSGSPLHFRNIRRQVNASLNYPLHGAFIIKSSLFRIRGRLGSYFILSINFGILVAFIAGSYLDYYIVARFMLMLPLIYIIVVLMLPETPYYLARNGKLRQAEKSLYFLRGCNMTPIIPPNVQLEFNKITQGDSLYPTLPAQQPGKFWSILNSMAERRAILIGVVLVLVNQLCGAFVLISYTSAVFEESGSTLSPNASSIVIALIQLIGSYVSTLAIDRIPRKILYSLSAMGTIVGLLMFGVHGFLSSFGFSLSIFSGVPIVSLSLIIFIASVGIIPLTFIILSEVLPQEVSAM